MAYYYAQVMEINLYIILTISLLSFNATVCSWTDVTIPQLSFSAYRNKLVIGQFKTLSC